MAIGRTFKEALQKGLRSLEIKRCGLESLLFKKPRLEKKVDDETLNLIYHKLRMPNADRIFYIGDALRVGIDIDRIYDLTKIDKWFLHNISEIIELEKDITAASGANLSRELLITAKQYGFSDKQIADLTERKEQDIYDLRRALNLMPDFKLVDTCAAEFEARTPYYYSTYDK